MQPSALFPINVPREYFSRGNWPGRHRLLGHPDLALTWVEFNEPSSMAYVNFERHDTIERMGFDVHSVAMENLRKASRPLTTHAKLESGRTVLCSMMHADGLGTSRLLLLPELDEAFPDGYWLGIPERSCGIVVPKVVSADEHEHCVGVVSDCYKSGTTPMLDGLFERSMFEVLDA